MGTGRQITLCQNEEGKMPDNLLLNPKEFEIEEMGEAGEMGVICCKRLIKLIAISSIVFGWIDCGWGGYES